MAHIKLDSTNRDDTSRNYLVNTNSTVLEDQLVDPIIKKGLFRKRKGELTNMLIANLTPKMMLIKIGKIIGFCRTSSEKERKGICTKTEMLKAKEDTNKCIFC